MTWPPFNLWKSKIIDHLCESTSRWRELLKKTQESEGPIMKKYLQDIHVGWGENAWAISEDLGNFLVKFLNKPMYNRRDQLWRGPDETGNGLEMWRRLNLEFEGGSEFVEYGGRKGFNRYPRCTKVAELHQHMDD